MEDKEIPDEIQRHDFELDTFTGEGKKLKLRPLTEQDWPLLNEWNSDQEVLYFAEGDEVEEYTPEQVKKIYRSVSENAYIFIIEYNETPIGECWLQEMNLQRIKKEYPEEDCWRVDMMIGEKEFWGKGIGTEVIKMLVRFGFDEIGADLIFGCDVMDYNVRSLKTAKKAGFEIENKLRAEEDKKYEYKYDLKIEKSGV
ncbi:MAG: GNAT family N-acetyltransferase [Candidatus Thermoplasmatota archaeon]